MPSEFRKFLLSAALLASAALPALSGEGGAMFVNGDFEHLDSKGRAVAWSLGRQMRVARGLGHNANGGLLWESAVPQEERLCSAVHRVDGFRPGDCFELSGLVKLDGFDKRGGCGCCFVVEWMDANGKWLCAPAARRQGSVRDGEWTLWKASGLVPERAAYGRVHLYVGRGSSGKASFDNIAITKISQAPVVFVCSSAYRDVAVDGPVDFHAVLTLEPGAKSAEAFFRWRDASGRDVRRRADRFGGSSASISLDAADLAEGASRVACELWQDGVKSGEAGIDFSRVATLPRRRVYIDSHRRCIVDGKPFFPLGMYWGRTTDATLGLYTNGAFNCVMPYQPMTLPILDKLRSCGIMTFSCVRDFDRTRLLKAMAEQKDHPALLGWYVMDEAGVAKLPEMVERYKTLREYDPDHPAYAVQDRVYDLRLFMPAADVFGLDPYPVASQPLSRVAKFARDGDKVLFGSRAFWNVPQAFAWRWFRPDTGEKGRFPTVEEIRSISWQHIAGGANGLVAYCFYRMIEPELEPDPAVRRDNFERVCVVSREIANLFPVLLSVEPCPVVKAADETATICRAWARDGDLYVLACNLADRDSSAEMSIGSGKWAVKDAVLGAPASVSGGCRLEVPLPPCGVSMSRLVRAD